VPRRRAQRLERVLGTPALFATANGNVGSSICYALGQTAALATGLTPIIVLGATRKSERMRRDVFGSTIEYVLKHAPCWVMVVSASAPAA
jgi:Universal stress protein family